MEHNGILLESRCLDIAQIVGDQFIPSLLSEKGDDRRILNDAHRVPPSSISNIEKQRLCHRGMLIRSIEEREKKGAVSFLQLFRLIKTSFASQTWPAVLPGLMPGPS